MSIQTVLDTFWDPDIWLPPNITWKDLESNEGIEYADYKHLLWPIPMAAVVLVIRYFIERHVYVPMGLLLGIKGSKPKKAVANEVLERAVRQMPRLRHKDIVGLAKQLDWSERQVERWLRLRRAQDRPTTLTKFTENGWRFTYYCSSFCFGMYALWDKPWLWNADLCWVNYPHQSMLPEMWWYYMTSLSFYWSLTLSHFFDVKRKDFWQMFAHHIITIVLLSLSWICNFTRIGCLTLALHDFADIFLEGEESAKKIKGLALLSKFVYLMQTAKMAKYAKYQKICDALFIIFTISWLTTRTGLFPFVILRSTTIRAPIIVQTPMFPAYYIFNGMLFLLLGLHLFWTYLILRIVKSSLTAGQMDGDIRSSSSDLSDTSTNSVALSAGDHNNTADHK